MSQNHQNAGGALSDDGTGAHREQAEDLVGNQPVQRQRVANPDEERLSMIADLSDHDRARLLMQ